MKSAAVGFPNIEFNGICVKLFGELNDCIGENFTVAKAEEKPVQRYAAPPFTTSTLQQEAGRRLGMSVSQTMSVAQKLYEQGLIT